MVKFYIEVIMKKTIIASIMFVFPVVASQEPEKSVETKIVHERGATVLHALAEDSRRNEFNKNVVLASLHMKNGIDVNAQNENGDTPLSLACMCDTSVPNQDLIRLLLDRGARVNTVNKAGKTPLLRAVKNVMLVRDLLAKGADICENEASALSLVFCREEYLAQRTLFLGVLFAENDLTVFKSLIRSKIKDHRDDFFENSDVTEEMIDEVTEQYVDSSKQLFDTSEDNDILRALVLERFRLKHKEKNIFNLVTKNQNKY